VFVAQVSDILFSIIDDDIDRASAERGGMTVNKKKNIIKKWEQLLDTRTGMF
jgi:hypothetical protein